MIGQSDIGLGNLGVALATGSGFNSRFERYLKDSPQLQNRRFDLAKTEGKKYVDEAKNFVEEQAHKNGKPVSSSRVFAYFLKQDQGSITEALFDTYIFLKFAARNSFATGQGGVAGEENVLWYKANITDEYGSSNYAVDSKNGLNKIGKAYHAWNLVALMAYLPKEFITWGGSLDS